MWKYSNQIIVRWLSFIVASAAILTLAWMMAGVDPQFLTQTGLKAALTRLSVTAEYLPIWVWPIVFTVIISLLLVGVPFIIPFAILLATSGFYPALAVTFLCQVFVTRLCIHWSWKRADNESYQRSVKPALRSLLWQNQKHFREFAFWSRVYYAYPLRSVDRLTPMIQPDEKQLMNTLLAAAPAILLRMLIPALWLDSLLRLLVNLTPTPASDITLFLLWSSAMVVYTMLPRTPEFFICAAVIRPILLSLEGATIPQKVTKSKAAASQSGKNKPAENKTAETVETANLEQNNQQAAAQT